MSYKILFSALCLFLITSTQVISQSPAFGILDINNVEARIFAKGNHFRDLQDSAHYQVPKGSGKHTIFSNAFWIGGEDSIGQHYVSAQKYSQKQEYTFGPLSTDGSLSTDFQTIDDYISVWKVSRDQIDQHIAWAQDSASMPGYSIPTDILSWPAHGDVSKNQSYSLAPFVDESSSGFYEPHKGDYPLIRGDQAIFFIFNDAGVPNNESQGLPPGVEIHGMAYAFDAPQCDAFHHTVFMNYKIHNRSNRTYRDTYLGLFTDFDIGYYGDDYLQVDVERGSMFAFNGEPVDGHGEPAHYGTNPPAQSITILGGPYMDPDGLDNPDGQCDESINGMNFGNGIVDDERLGMTRALGFKYQPQIPPSSPPSYYNYLHGKWADSSDVLYGEGGHANLGAYGPPCRFMYPGDSDPCNWGTGGVAPNGPPYWTMETAGLKPGDIYGLVATGPFTFEAGTVQNLDFAFVYGRDTTTHDSIGNLASVDKLLENIDVIRNGFITNQGPHGDSIVTSAKTTRRNELHNVVKLFPNPASNALTIQTGKQGTHNYQVYDLQGRLLIDNHAGNTDDFTIDVSKLPEGMYILSVFSEDGRSNHKFVKQ